MVLISLYFEAMEYISPFIEPITSFLMKHIKYIVKARTNVDTMANHMAKLRALQLDLKNNIEDAERERAQSTEIVNLWLKNVEEVENEVATIKYEYDNRRCRFFGYFSLNCCLTYKCGKRAVEKSEKLVQLETERSCFPSITTMPPRGLGEAMQIESTILGLDSYVERIQNHLIDDTVRIIGIYGMGGVGKTTLLKKVNNALLQGNKLRIKYMIWIVVSKEFQLKKVQADVAKVLALKLKDEDDESEHARDIYNYLKDRSFLLFLDDVWEYIDLVKVGIPDPRAYTSSSSSSQTKRIQKVILTTRSMEVCGSMGANKIIKVECLNPNNAKALFMKTLGESNLQSDLGIHSLVEEVIDECAGLPLALTVIARAMASKKSMSEWRAAVRYLNSSQANKILVDEKLNMLPTLCLSYDSLAGDGLRRCFLYCSLWPEDFEIEVMDLILFCIANEVIKGFDSMSEAYDMGRSLIEGLKAACLLEDASKADSVKMHDVLRDLALWIATDRGESPNKWLVKSGIGLREAPLKAEKWREAEVVSLRDNDIRVLPSVTFECPILSILLLSSNYLERIHPSFFQNMYALTYLDLSQTGISELPESITLLARLRCLNLEYTGGLEYIPSGMISSLMELQILNLLGSGVCRSFDDVSEDSDEESATVPDEESATVREDSDEESATVREDSDKESATGRDEESSNGREMIGREKSLLEELECLPGGLKGLTLHVSSADAFRRLSILSHVIWRLGLARLPGLTTLRLEQNMLNSLQSLMMEGCANVEILEFVAKTCPIDFLAVVSLPKLKGILCRGVAPSVLFPMLRSMYIDECHSLKSISWIVGLPSLAFLTITRCYELKCLVDDEDENSTAAVAFPSLRNLKLYLWNLSCICGPQYHLPSLETLVVDGCPKLKKLPLLSNNKSEISCDRKWWDGLEWDDESIKASWSASFDDLETSDEEDIQ